MAEQNVTDEEALEEIEETAEDESLYDLLFPVVPLEDDPAADEEGLYALVDDIDDFAQDSASEDPVVFAEENESGTTDYAFDYDFGDFYLDETGQPQRVSEADAVVEWAIKALNTPKGAYAIYSPEYGSDLQEIVGLGVPDAIAHALIADSVTSCLAQHPAITDVEIDAIFRSPSLGVGAYLVSLSLYLDEDDEAVSFEVRV